MKNLQPKYAVYSYGRQGFVLLSPRNMEQHTCDSHLSEFLEQTAINLEKCAKSTKNQVVKVAAQRKHVKTLYEFAEQPAKELVKKHADTFMSLAVVIIFLSLMVV